MPDPSLDRVGRRLDASRNIAARVDRGVPFAGFERRQAGGGARVAIADEMRDLAGPWHRLHATREKRHVVASRKCRVDQMPAEESRAAQNEESHVRREPSRRGSGAANAAFYARGTIFTPASFSCASISDATYLSPNPRRFAVTRLWCTASPTMHGTGSDSARCV